MDLDCPDSHRVNRAENWLNGNHCNGLVQCGTCGRKKRYDITFSAHMWKIEKRFSERVNGQWRRVASPDDLVFEFEQMGCGEDHE